MIVWTTGPRFGLRVGKAGGGDSAVGGRGGSGLLTFGGATGEARVEGRTRRVGAVDGGEETQVREGGLRTTGGVGSWGVEGIVTDLDAMMSALSSFTTSHSSPAISQSSSLSEGAEGVLFSGPTRFPEALWQNMDNLIIWQKSWMLN
jgi:hypothetical protein